MFWPSQRSPYLAPEPLLKTPLRCPLCWSSPQGMCSFLGGQVTTAADFVLPEVLPVDIHSLHRTSGLQCQQSNSTSEAERRLCWDPGLSSLEPAEAGLCRLSLHQKKQRCFWAGVWLLATLTCLLEQSVLPLDRGPICEFCFAFTYGPKLWACSAEVGPSNTPGASEPLW